ncbi:MAG: DUF1273 domain-containing protein [Bacillus sp. (in: firmicutes)]
MLKVLAITGYKNFELGIFKNDSKEADYIKRAIQKQLTYLVDEGLEWVIITGQLGVELWAGEATIKLRGKYSHLKLAVMTPFLYQENNWNDQNKQYYEYICSQADFVETLSKQPYVSPIQFKNRDQFLLNKCDGMLIVYDEERDGSPRYMWKQVKQYQERHDFICLQLNFYDLQQFIEDELSEHTTD